MKAATQATDNNHEFHNKAELNKLNGKQLAEIIMTIGGCWRGEVQPRCKAPGLS